MRKFLFILFFICGCSTANKGNNSIRGNISSVDFLKEDCNHIVVIVKFEDNRIVKLTSRCDKPLVFKTGTNNIIWYNDNALIENVGFFDEQEL